ncbi:MAG: hypothetical protein ACUVRZ_07275 [Desulfobacca sp.]
MKDFPDGTEIFFSQNPKPETATSYHLVALENKGRLQEPAFAVG